MAYDTAAANTRKRHRIQGTALRLAVDCLQERINAAGPDRHPTDPGIPVLAYLVADADPATAAAAVTAWAKSAGRGPSHPALHEGGLAGTLVGLRLGARLHPVLHRAADRLRDHLTAPTPAYRTQEVAFPDYDLICGPSGTLLALCVGATPTPSQLGPLIAHLTRLCDGEGLPRLRTGQYEGHPHLAWMQGRINTGMVHGIAGLITALTAALRCLGPDQELTDALTRATHWLARQAYDDDRAIRSWPRAGGDGPPPAGPTRRQAWCYGTPGVAWALWDEADALGDRESADRAAAAFTTLAERYDEDFHLSGDTPGDLLGLCHGAAGVLAVTDAFNHHAHLPAAATLKKRLVHHLETRLPETVDDWPPGLLGGLPGALSALLTAAPGTSRAWLPPASGYADGPTDPATGRVGGPVDGRADVRLCSMEGGVSEVTSLLAGIGACPCGEPVVSCRLLRLPR
ncbi:lanthionine synthetase LanC family protein [Streptomyces sp. CSDS2]|uniref:lanthionine synthetase LanC family protein n=1 Tax=Streptomyces sp. CSDS2 TaxID=3055051 RepID=UPI0025AFCEF3|nr:lanthionine synthetase LanC family protein [Streptomyces sp. CSDS2]MDN3258797.1 lanthionine synthetase LanC family protein [Streptomyces sp. CSDS2]